MYGSRGQPAPPLFTSPANVTLGTAVQLSASSVTTLTSGSCTFAMHWKDNGVGLLAVGFVLSITLIVCVTFTFFPYTTLFRSVRVTMYGSRGQPAPPLFTSPANVTLGTAVQLSASSVTTLTSGAGSFAMHWKDNGVGLLAVGFVLSITVIVCVTLMLLPHASATL